MQHSKQASGRFFPDHPAKRSHVVVRGLAGMDTVKTPISEGPNTGGPVMGGIYLCLRKTPGHELTFNCQ